ncbi:VOC family protein [Flavobacteriaceae bacterium TP-CH-4]|uniref:VOC family protein n=1 Tax=Pelagihabitans pacificus TaxID=2696054 RepID=A0A967AXQ6_9FLAO|nr:VOC family protein [Pelagihabitans pacificus]NHF58511.1 VOC family protein [Pelagihabitans pacificus]
MLRESYTFNSYATNNIESSKKFYGETLGLQVVENEMGILEIKAGGSNRFVIYPKENHQPATFTVLNFEVKNIQSEVDDLIAKGITFEQYPEPMKTDEKGICRRDDRFAIAWFKDPAGNIISLIQENQ